MLTHLPQGWTLSQKTFFSRQAKQENAPPLLPALPRRPMAQMGLSPSLQLPSAELQPVDTMANTLVMDRGGAARPV